MVFVCVGGGGEVCDYLKINKFRKLSGYCCLTAVAQGNITGMFVEIQDKEVVHTINTRIFFSEGRQQLFFRISN